MASLLVGASLLIHDKIKGDRAKRREKKRKGYEVRYSELEKEHKSHEADVLHRKSTGGSMGNQDTSAPGPAPRSRNSQDSLRSNQDGPARWVEEALKENQSKHS
ncbi:uncharacterized protein HMPREF1541_01128 [Cyphellophora europaea CBS 101466]|uniref:Uncharacterized protein n=1 Tax=Cyphellophora europaea (strain CBS 101466) TaxID=1220924 RepID=W2SGE4_CYPE1|nr:uncharacterized protein HMPREF1541_01128 [Cyphellophora europaea CBS 101466]ETN46939.1 hypothetical protein HMPREF1541_01128 [Cyphellophora europaea CBS 101466]